MIKYFLSNEEVKGSLIGMICLLTSIISFVSAIFNFILGLNIYFNFLLLVVAPVFFVLHNHFKKIKIKQWQYTLFIMFVFLVLSFSWFLQNGIVGGTLIMYLFFQLVLLLLTKAEHIKYVLPLLLFYFCGLFVAQHLFPNIVIPYENQWIQKLDVFTNSFIVLFFMGYIVYNYKIFENEQKLILKDSIAEKEKATLEAERFSKMQSEFIANVSHEIRTPLNGIIGHSELILNMNAEEDPQEYLKSIAKSGQLLLGLINNILDVSKIESNSLEVQPIDFQLSTVLSEVESIFQVDLVNNGIDLKIEVKDNLPDYLYGDVERIKQILVNILSNAIKFTHDGVVKLSISFEQIEKDINLVISVKDSGIGISEENLDKVFDRFYQISQSHNRKYQGSGLGLIIVKKLVELMGGSITITSQEKVGTQVSFNIHVKTSIKKNTKKEEVKLQKNLKILVAEDNEINQMLMIKQLSSLGYYAQLADDGLAVLDKVAVENFDLIFMDVQMPEMDGLEATQEIRKRNVHQPIIIAITANASSEDRQKCLEVGMDDYLTKPVNLEGIRLKIEQYFEL